jgi:hypothetical protein
MLLLPGMALAVSCALWRPTYRPPRAPETEAAKVKFPWGTPRDRVVLSGVWLRAVTLALDDFLPAGEAEQKPENEIDACLARRENFLAEAWVWSPERASDGGGETGPELDGGSIRTPDAGFEADAGSGDAFGQPGMPQVPPIIYVTVGLMPGHCELDGSPLLDVGAVYAIDTVGWRILAIHH